MFKLVLSPVYLLLIVLLGMQLNLIAYAIAEEKPAFSSEVYRLVGSKKSQALNADLYAGQHISTSRKAYVPKQALLEYKTIMNSGGLLSSFPMTKELAELYLSELDNSLAEKKNITLLHDVKPTDPQPDAAVITMVSLVPDKDNNTFMEVVLLVFDWKKANAIKAEPMRAIREAAVWQVVTRVLLPISSAGKDNWGERQEIKDAYLAQIKSATQLFMAPF